MIGSRVYRDRLDAERIQHEAHGAQAQALGPLLRIARYTRTAHVLHVMSVPSSPSGQVRVGLDRRCC